MMTADKNIACLLSTQSSHSFGPKSKINLNQNINIIEKLTFAPTHSYTQLPLITHTKKYNQIKKCVTLLSCQIQFVAQVDSLEMRNTEKQAKSKGKVFVENRFSKREKAKNF